MALSNKHITDSTATDIATKPRRLHVQVNKAFTGTITIKDGSSTIGVVTDPTVGLHLLYGPFNGVASVTASTTCDISAWSE